MRQLYTYTWIIYEKYIYLCSFYTLTGVFMYGLAFKFVLPREHTQILPISNFINPSEGDNNDRKYILLLEKLPL